MSEYIILAIMGALGIVILGVVFVAICSDSSSKPTGECQKYGYGQASKPAILEHGSRAIDISPTQTEDEWAEMLYHDGLEG